MATTNTVRAAAVVVAALIGVVLAVNRPAIEDGAPPATTPPAPVVEAPAIDAMADDAHGDITPSPPPPMEKRKPLSEDVLWGLRWLKNRQAKDGSWHDPATTGVALLAFLGAGETQLSGSCRETVKSGLVHMRDLQGADGCLAPRGSARMLRDHAIAGLALCDAYGMTNSRVFKYPAERAVAFAAKSRTPSSGWSRPDGRLDFEATVWMSMLLKSAKPPVRDPGRSPDYAAWYFGTLAVWHMGPDQRWPPWAKALIAAVAGGQRTDDGDAERGSWDPPAGSANDADRVWSTAFSLFSVAPITSNWYPRVMKKR